MSPRPYKSFSEMPPPPPLRSEPPTDEAEKVFFRDPLTEAGKQLRTSQERQTDDAERRFMRSDEEVESAYENRLNPEEQEKSIEAELVAYREKETEKLDRAARALTAAWKSLPASLHGLASSAYEAAAGAGDFARDISDATLGTTMTDHFRRLFGGKPRTEDRYGSAATELTASAIADAREFPTQAWESLGGAVGDLARVIQRLASGGDAKYFAELAAQGNKLTDALNNTHDAGISEAAKTRDAMYVVAETVVNEGLTLQKRHDTLSTQLFVSRVAAEQQSLTHRLDLEMQDIIDNFDKRASGAEHRIELAALERALRHFSARKTTLEQLHGMRVLVEDIERQRTDAKESALALLEQDMIDALEEADLPANIKDELLSLLNEKLTLETFGMIHSAIVNAVNSDLRPIPDLTPAQQQAFLKINDRFTSLAQQFTRIYQMDVEASMGRLKKAIEQGTRLVQKIQVGSHAQTTQQERTAAK